MKRTTLFMAFLFMAWFQVIFPVSDQTAEGATPRGLLTEQEIATEKFLASLEATLAKKFFDVRRCPVIRVAVFDFTDGEGNVVKAGRELAERITKRLYLESQFEVVSKGKLDQYLTWNGLTALGKLDAPSLRSFQQRIDTLDPGNELNTLVFGEVKKSVGRSLNISAFLVNFQFKIGPFELEKNIIDFLPLTGEIPLPTEQALQEANEIVLRADNRPRPEGRLLILANTRGNALLETEVAKQLNKEQPFPWDKAPHVFIWGREEVSVPEQIKIGMGSLFLLPTSAKRNSIQGLQYSFLHGKLATNEVYLDKIIPAAAYPLVTSFLDSKTNETFSQTVDVQVYPETTTIVVLSIFVPSEKERIRNRQAPRLDIFQLYGKGVEIFPPR